MTYETLLRQYRAEDAWWDAYARAKESGEDMSAWLDAHPHPGSEERAAEVRRRLEKA